MCLQHSKYMGVRCVPLLLLLLLSEPHYAFAAVLLEAIEMLKPDCSLN